MLVDSAVYIDFLRHGRDIRQKLLPHLRAGTLYNSGVVRAEVLRGLKAPLVRDGMEAFFDIIPEIPTDGRMWREVSTLGWQLGRAGKWPPVTDLVIAVSALRIRAILVSPDKHFSDIPGLEWQRELAQ